MFRGYFVWERLGKQLPVLPHLFWRGNAVPTLLINVRQSYWARYCPSVCLSVRQYVRHSVTRWYCVETAQPIVKLSSLPGSPMILVLWGPNFSPEFQWEHPNGGVKCKGGRKKLQFPTNIARKQLKIDVYMLRCVWPLCPTSSHQTWWTCILLRMTSRLEQSTCVGLHSCWTRHCAFQEHT